jgi:hypothetical protein
MSGIHSQQGDMDPFPARQQFLTIYYVLVVSSRKAHIQIFIMNLVEESWSVIPRSRMCHHMFLCLWFTDLNHTNFFHIEYDAIQIGV